MSTEGVLDDYLGELLGDIAKADAADVAAAADADVLEQAGEAGDTGEAAMALLDDAALQAAFDAAATLDVTDINDAGATDIETAEANPTLAGQDAPPLEPRLDVHEQSQALDAATEREPTWDDLPDAVIYETDDHVSAALANADGPHLEAAFEAATATDGFVATPGPTSLVAAPVIPAVPAPPTATPTARAPASLPATAPTSEAPATPATTWQQLQAQPANSPHPHRRSSERTTRWLRLRCGRQAYALELLKVQEVVLPVPLLPLRGTAPAMLGIMNLRGQVVPVMDLGLHLGAACAEEDTQTRIVVLEENGEIMGLRVSAVEDVTNLTDSQIEPPDTARICRISNEVFRGVARLNQQPMILLDATRLLG